MISERQEIILSVIDDLYRLHLRYHEDEEVYNNIREMTHHIQTVVRDERMATLPAPSDPKQAAMEEIYLDIVGQDVYGSEVFATTPRPVGSETINHEQAAGRFLGSIIKFLLRMDAKALYEHWAKHTHVANRQLFTCTQITRYHAPRILRQREAGEITGQECYDLILECAVLCNVGYLKTCGDGSVEDWGKPYETREKIEKVFQRKIPAYKRHPDDGKKRVSCYPHRARVFAFMARVGLHGIACTWKEASDRLTIR